MRPSDPQWAERFIALTGFAWVALSLCRGVLVAPRYPGFAPVSDRPLFGVHVALAVLVLCWLARRRATARSARALRNLPAIAAAILVLLSAEGQVAGFHTRSPSPWECIALCSTAIIIAVAGGRLLRSRSTSR